MHDLKVGFIGLGTMGQGMAQNILGHEFDLMVYNRTASKAEFLAEKGAVVANDLKDLEACDVVFTMVSDDNALRSICFESGLLDIMKPGSIHISSSTISTDLAEELKSEHAKRNQQFAGAPVSGRGDFALQGKLFIIYAGSAEILEVCMPIFEAIGQKTINFGQDPTSAFVCKLAVNAMIANAIGSISETYRLVEAWGIDRVQFNDFVTNGLFASPAYQAYGKLMAHHDYLPANFPVGLGLKDVRLAFNAAEQKNVQMPCVSAVRNLLMSALDQQMEEFDWSAIAIAAYPKSNNKKTRMEKEGSNV